MGFFHSLKVDQMNLDSLAGLAHPLFRFGIPHETKTLIPIPTNSHFIQFDTSTVSPRFCMARLMPGTEDKNVGRDDDFVSEFTLPPELRTKSSDYAAWNKENPENPMDQGHVIGSQMRRSDRQLQHDIDSLAGVIPESPALNRFVKNPLECKIVEKAQECIDCYYVAGPSYLGGDYGMLRSGQLVPTGSWIACLFRTSTKVEVYVWMMDNVQDRDAVNLRTISLEDLEEITGLHVFGGLQGIDRSKVDDKDWWK